MDIHLSNINNVSTNYETPYHAAVFNILLFTSEVQLFPYLTLWLWSWTFTV